MPTIIVSGTASITGHESRHAGDVAAQVAETLTNLAAVIAAAGATPADPGWALKIYLRDLAARPAVEAALAPVFGAAPRLYLHADICRPELLVEIEAFRQFG